MSTADVVECATASRDNSRSRPYTPPLAMRVSRCRVHTRFRDSSDLWHRPGTVTAGAASAARAAASTLATA
eukprot:1742080-Prymnesium_polylepis.1